MSPKMMWTLVILAAAVVGVWFLYKWWKGYQAQGGGPLGTLGTNLNSIAPELVGGSSGPTAQPAVDVPVNITLTSTTAASQPPAEAMVPMNNNAAGSPDNNSNALYNANPTDNGQGMSTVPEDSSQQVPLIKQTPPDNGIGNGNGGDKKDHRDKRHRDRDRH